MSTMNRQHRSSRAKRCGAYTIIEVFVGTILISVAVAAVVQAVGQSSTIAKKDFLRRRAYQHLERILEQPEHGYRGNYYLEGHQGTAYPDGLEEAITTPHDLGDVCLDDKDTPEKTDDLMASCALRVKAHTGTSLDLLGTSVDDFRYLMLTAIVQWDFQGITETESLQTIVSVVDIN